MSILALKLRNLEFTQTQSIHSPKASQDTDLDSLHIGFYTSEELVYSPSGTSLVYLPPFSGKAVRPPHGQQTVGGTAGLPPLPGERKGR